MEGINIPILYEDDYALVVDKPSGILTHPANTEAGLSLHDWLADHYPALKEVGEPIVLDGEQTIDRFGIAHRLDKETSGVLLIAKDQATWSFFKRQFKAKQIQKVYSGLVYGRPKQSRGLIDRPIGRHSKDPRRRAAGRLARGELREARTTYILELSNQEVGLLRLIPHTGRTHQLRVHCSSLGHPIVADPLYAPHRPKLLGFTRLALHASFLTFRLPQQKEPVTVSAPWPVDFKTAVSRLEGR